MRYLPLNINQLGTRMISLKLLFNWVKKKKNRAKGHVLLRDFTSIIKNAQQSHGRKKMKLIAKLTVAEIAEVHERSAGKLKFYNQGIKNLRDRNNNFKNQNNQPAWTAGVLAHIYLESEKLGLDGAPARAALSNFFKHNGFKIQK